MIAVAVSIILALVVTAIMSVAVGFLWLLRWQIDAPMWIKLLFW